MLSPSSTVLKFRLLALKDLRNVKSVLALHFPPGCYHWSSRKVGGIATPVARTAWEACAVRWLRNRKRLPWKSASTCCKASSPRMTSFHSHSRSVSFIRLSSSCLSSKARKLQNARRYDFDVPVHPRSKARPPAPSRKKGRP
jgi:hypothetical protein